MITNPKEVKADEAGIHRLMAKWSDALEAKDAEGLTADYAPEALLFDAIPPYKRVGAEAIREAWNHCLPFFPDTLKSEHRDISIHVDGDVAFAHGLHHIIAGDHPAAKSWLRVTVGYAASRAGGKWCTSMCPFLSTRWTTRRGPSRIRIQSTSPTTARAAAEEVEHEIHAAHLQRRRRLDGGGARGMHA